MSGEYSAPPAEFVRLVCLRPEMMVHRGRYYSVAAVFEGYDCCCERFALNTRFHDWLVNRLGVGSSPMVWYWLVLQVFLGSPPVSGYELPEALDADAVRVMGDLLLEYLGEQTDKPDTVSGGGTGKVWAGASEFRAGGLAPSLGGV